MLPMNNREFQTVPIQMVAIIGNINIHLCKAFFKHGWFMKYDIGVNINGNIPSKNFRV